MKVFISGSKSLNKDGGDWLFPDSIRDCLDSIMSEGNEILIGDCLGADTIVQEYLKASEFSKVTVYSSGSHPKMRSNLGHWEEKHFSPNGKTAYVFRIEKDFHMAEDCDCGVAIWDGNSKGTFINILCLCALKKPCKLYLIQEDRWLNINLLEDLRRLAGSEGEITDKEIREVLTKCYFSDEMIEYLTSKSAISPYQLIDIISRAPITLDEKMLFFSSLGNKRNLKFEVFSSVAENIKTGKNFKKIKHDIRAIADFRGKRTIWTELYDRSIALEEAKDYLVGDLDHNLPLFLFSEWYDIDELQLKSSDVGLFVTTRAVEKYIANEEADNDTDEGYYRMEAWDDYDENWEKSRYDYYLYRGKICWFEKLRPEKQEHGNTYYMSENREFAAGSLDLDFKTPYKPGDIVLIDCRPFGPPFHAMILEARDQFDCCFPNIVFQYPGTNEWNLTPLKHRMLYKDIGWHTYLPILSPLYRLRKIKDDEMTEEDAKLLELSNVISGSEEKAGKVWENWRSPAGDDILSWEQVLEVFESVRY